MEEKGNQAFGTVVVKETKSIKMFYCPLQKKNMVTKGEFYLVTNVSIGTAVNARENSKVFSAKMFKIKELEEEEEKFINPTIVNVEEAMNSPLKRRITVSANLQSVSPIYEGDRCKRRIIELEGSDSATCMKLKLWGTKTQIHIPTPNTPVFVKSVEVREYNGIKELHSTPDTVIEEDAENTEIQGEILAACFDRDDMNILLNEQIYRVENTHMTDIFANEEFEEGWFVKIIVKRDRILQVLEKRRNALD